MLSAGLSFDEMKEVLKLECERRKKPRHRMLEIIRSLVPELHSWVCIQIETGIRGFEEVRYFTVKTTTRLEPVLKRFMKSKKTSYNFVVYGRSASGDDTPYALGMNDNDKICAHRYQ